MGSSVLPARPRRDAWFGASGHRPTAYSVFGASERRSGRKHRSVFGLSLRKCAECRHHCLNRGCSQCLSILCKACFEAHDCTPQSVNSRNSLDDLGTSDEEQEEIPQQIIETQANEDKEVKLFRKKVKRITRAMENAKATQVEMVIMELKAKFPTLQVDILRGESQTQGQPRTIVEQRSRENINDADAILETGNEDRARMIAEHHAPENIKDVDTVLQTGDSIVPSRSSKTHLSFFYVVLLLVVCLVLVLVIPSRRAAIWSDSIVAAQRLAPMREFGEFLHGEVATRIKESACTNGDTMSIVNNKQLHYLARKEWDRHPTIHNSNSQLFLWDVPAPVVERTSKWIGIGQSFGLFGKSTHPKKPTWNKRLDAELWRNLDVVSAGFEMNPSTPYNKTFHHLLMVMMSTKIPFNESGKALYSVGFKAEDHGLNSFKQVGQHTLSLLHALGSSTPRCCVIKDGRKCHSDCNGIDVMRFPLPPRHVEKLGLHDRSYVVEIRIGDKRSEMFQELFGCAAEVLLI